MTRFHQAQFHLTVNDRAGLPTAEGLEVAFAGRSNAGKSSAINLLANRKRLAFTSKTPGRTQQINFFRLDNGDALVDLPGYGYAEVPHAVKRHWQQLLADYLAERQALCGLVLLMDIRHPLTTLDQQMLEWFLPRGKPVVVLLTKSDKLGFGARQRAVKEVREALADSPAPITVIPFSSLNREGLEAAEAAIEGLYRVNGL